MVVNIVRAIASITTIFHGRIKFRNRKGGVVGSRRRKCEGDRGAFPGDLEDCKMWGKVGASADVAAVLAEFSSSL